MSNQRPTDVYPKGPATEEELLQATTLQYYLHETNPANGPDPRQDRPGAPASIAAVGLGLASTPMLVERGVISREFAPELALRPLRFFRDSPQGPEPDATGYRGFYYHFLDMKTGRRVWHCELSTIDSAFLLRRDAHLRGLLRRRHRGGGRGPSVGGRALPAGGLAVGARRRRGGFPRLAARDRASSRTPGPATTRRSWSTCSASARRRFPCRPRATPPTARPTSGRRSTAASCSTRGRCSRTSSRTSGSTSAASRTRSCATTTATTSRTLARRPTSSRSTRAATRSSSPATASTAGASPRATARASRRGG